MGQGVTNVRGESKARGLRNRLIDQLKAEGAVVSPAVEKAMRHVPREKFATWLSPDEAYENKAFANPLASKAESTISQPSAVARFLEGFALEPGITVLEVGAGTGYQAALMSDIVGARGKVVTIDIAESLVEEAGRNLRSLNITNVQVVHGDGALGYPQSAPYDRIVATVGLRDVPWAWTGQLKEDGRIVVPLHLGGEPQTHVLVSLKRRGDGLVGRGLDVLNMVLLQGTYADVEEQVKHGEAWTGAYANALKIHMFPKDLSVEPEATQKLIHKKDTTVLLEAD